MNDLATDIRDGIITGLTLSYDWNRSEHSIELSVKKNGIKTYALTNVRQLNITEDFKCQNISHCKAIQVEEGIYLSLDPYDETPEVDDRDNFVIIAADVTVCENPNGQQFGNGNAVKPPGDERSQ